MGLMTELFVAREEDARTYDHASAGRFQSVQLGGLTNLEFETLWAVLSGDKWSGKTHRLENVASTEGTWTFKFPSAYVEKLRGLDSAAGGPAAVWGEDVSEATIRKKLSKSYPVACDVELILYANGRTVLTDDTIRAKLEPILQDGIGQYKRVWLFGYDLHVLAPRDG